MSVGGISGANTNGPSWVPVVFVNTNTLSPSAIILFIVVLKSGNAVLRAMRKPFVALTP
ncbi:MAG TPA: hypothetical protein VFT71_07295 [Candidatus Nitrosocosmicus sp.]|nr:hypothetical protein [Candidatus Nitrosocosmicus sp.]